MLMPYNKYPYAASRCFIDDRVGKAVQREGSALISRRSSQTWLRGKNASNSVELIEETHYNASARIFPVSTARLFDVKLGSRVEGVAHPYFARSLSTALGPSISTTAPLSISSSR